MPHLLLQVRCSSSYLLLQRLEDRGQAPAELMGNSRNKPELHLVKLTQPLEFIPTKLE